MPRRFQFTVRALLILMLAVACFFGGLHFERERQRRAGTRPKGYVDARLQAELGKVPMPHQ